MTNNNPFYPFTLVEYDSGCSVILSENHDMKWDLFEACGYSGNGYDWARLVSRLAHDKLPEDQAKLINYDPEAGMFSAYGQDKAALQMLSELVAGIYEDEVKLKQAIETYAYYGDD